MKSIKFQVLLKKMGDYLFGLIRRIIEWRGGKKRGKKAFKDALTDIFNQLK